MICLEYPLSWKIREVRQKIRQRSIIYGIIVPLVTLRALAPMVFNLLPLMVMFPILKGNLPLN
jgi:hypothetical protein